MLAAREFARLAKESHMPCLPRLRSGLAGMPLIVPIVILLFSNPAAGAEAPPATAAEEPSQVDALRREIAALREEYLARVQALEEKLTRLTESAAVPVAAPPIPVPPAPLSIVSGAGGKNFLNLSLDGLIAGGASTGDDVSALQTGGHDPAQRGFTVQNVEAVFEGAVDPYFRGQANVLLQISPGGILVPHPAYCNSYFFN